MFIKISTLIVLYYFYLDAYLVNATIVDIPESLIRLSFFNADYLDLDGYYRIKNKNGDIKSLKKNTIDQACKLLQIRRLQKLYPTVSVDEQSTEFGDFVTQPKAFGAQSIAKYNKGYTLLTWEIGQFEYLLLPVYGTQLKKEIYHVPTLTYVDAQGNRYTVDDGYFGLDDYNAKGQPLIFEVITRNDETIAKLVAYEDSVRFQFP